MMTDPKPQQPQASGRADDLAYEIRCARDAVLRAVDTNFPHRRDSIDACVNTIFDGLDAAASSPASVPVPSAQDSDVIEVRKWIRSDAPDEIWGLLDRMRWRIERARATPADAGVSCLPHNNGLRETSAYRQPTIEDAAEIKDHMTFDERPSSEEILTGLQAIGAVIPTKAGEV